MSLDSNRLAHWSKMVKTLYFNRCARSRSKKHLEAHHLYPKSIYPKKAYSLNNGVCLCRYCHREAPDSLHSLIPLEKCNPRTYRKWIRQTTTHFKDLYFILFIMVLFFGFILIASSLK